MLLAQLSEFPEPQEGETTCVLSLTEGPNATYRLRAYTAGPTPRDIGRWMSDCPLTVSETALLWVTRFNWQIQQQQGSLDINQVLEVVERPEPMNPIDPNTNQFIHPLDMVMLIAANLPPKDPTSPETGAQLQLGRVVAPAAPPPGPRGLIPGPVAAAPSPQRRLPAASRAPAPPVQVRPGQLGERERDLARFMRELVMAMRQGQPIEVARQAIFDYFEGDVPDGFEEDLLGPDETEDYEDYPPAVLELAGQLLRANPHLDEEAALDEALAIYEAQTVARFQPGDSPLPALPTGVRPLGPDEPLPGHIDPAQRAALGGLGGESGTDRAKLQRGWARTAAMRRRAGPLPPGLRHADAGIPLPAPAPVPAPVPVRHPSAAPRQPTVVVVDAAGPTNGAGGALSREDADRIAQEQINKAQAAANERAARSAAARDAARAAHEQEQAEAQVEAEASVVPAQPVPVEPVLGLGNPPTSEGAEA